MNSRKIVITGGPGTGKSTLINALDAKGYTCFKEISRQVILNARNKGIDQLFLSKPLLFSKLLLEGRQKQFIRANSITKQAVFFDRGVHDVLAYMDYAKVKYPIQFTNVCKDTIYDTIFILKPWKSIYTVDNERYENFEQTQQIHDHIINTYSGYNYNFIDVPFDTVEKRTDFIIKTLNM